MTTLTEKKICGTIPAASRELSAQVKQWNIALGDIESCKDIHLLIGADYANYIMTGTFLNVTDGLVAIKTKLGWTLQGKVDGQKDPRVCTLFSKAELDIADLWNLEAIGILDKPRDGTDEVIESFRQNLIVNSEGRYETTLPWKHDRTILSSNKDLAEKRLFSTTKRLKAIGKITDYDNAFQEWLKLGIIEEVEPDDGQGHYLAHHAVIKESSLTTKTRPVFDASAKGKNKYSLNACLEKGVNLIELIPTLLTRFRMNAVGISADIAKAFLQISLKESDRTYLKFLWWKDSELKEIITYRHCRVVFGLTCSPFLLAGTIKHHLENYNGPWKETAERLLYSFYTDNCVTSLEEEEVPKFVSEAREIMAMGKFDLRGWVTAPNSESVPDYEEVSVLGLNWNTKDDVLTCKVESLNTMKQGNITKRSLLSIAHRVFDPIGFMAPTTLIPKLILQRAWLTHKRHDWDDELPESLTTEFENWQKEVAELNNVKIPRRLSSLRLMDGKRSLHIFCDASMNAYATCIFMRTEKDDVVNVSLVLAKARVAPSKQQVTIPRLELLAAVIGTRLSRLVQDAHCLEFERFGNAMRMHILPYRDE
ncbi:uncharacterized protein LOC114353336 [Ostrinia furnacalis]|uniref:uncharacterized protein LOC114353336 n=1 Tax=Ostrinia furnacalis TaxID=93504 RepID=UPI001038AD2E|nr:uncharacterized protein LOC114353336 [Ostrinia furnacalis]